MNNLFITSGHSKGMSYTLKDGVTTIGRAPDNDIRIPDATISRHHSKILKKGGKVFIIDLNSTQGTLVDGQVIEPGVEVELKRHNTMRMGQNTLSFQKPTHQITGTASIPQDGKRRPFDTREEHIKDSSRSYIQSLELLLTVANILTQSLNIDDLLNEVINQIFKALKRIDRSAILLLDKETNALLEVASKTRIEDSEGLFSKINYSRTIVNRAIKNRRPVLMANTNLVDKADLSNSIEIMNVMSVMCVPLIYKEEIRGVIYVDSIGLSEGFRKDDLKVLTGLGNTAAIAIENARLYETLRQELVERKRTEAELQRIRDELEKLVKKRTAELSNTVDFLKQEIAEHMRVEGALRESEEKYRSLFEESREPVFITTRLGKFVEVNRSFLNLFGYTREEMQRLKAQDTYANPDDRIMFQRDIEAKGSVRGYKITLRAKNGTKIDCLLTANVRKSDDGTILGYQGIIHHTMAV